MRCSLDCLPSIAATEHTQMKGIVSDVAPQNLLLSTAARLSRSHLCFPLLHRAVIGSKTHLGPLNFCKKARATQGASDTDDEQPPSPDEAHAEHAQQGTEDTEQRGSFDDLIAAAATLVTANPGEPEGSTPPAAAKGAAAGTEQR